MIDKTWTEEERDEMAVNSEIEKREGEIKATQQATEDKEAREQRDATIAGREPKK